MSIELYVLISPSYGSIHRTQDGLEMATVHDPKYGKTIVPTDLKRGCGRFLGQLLRPEYVDLVGRQRLLSAPCEVARELPDGGVLILLASSPLALPLETIGQGKVPSRPTWGETFSITGGNQQQAGFLNSDPTQSRNGDVRLTAFS